MMCDNWGIVPALLLVINSFLDKQMKTSLMQKTPPTSFTEPHKCLLPAHPRLGGFLNACVILPSLRDMGWKRCEQKNEEKWKKKGKQVAETLGPKIEQHLKDLHQLQPGEMKQRNASLLLQSQKLHSNSNPGEHLSITRTSWKLQSGDWLRKLFQDPAELQIWLRYQN